MSGSAGFETLTQFFEKPACQRATEPLRKGVEIAVIVDGSEMTLKKDAKSMAVLEGLPAKPDMTFRLSQSGLQSLLELQTDDIGEIGIALLKLMVHEDPAQKMQAKVHIGPVDLFVKGYLSVLPLGGPTVMKFLASKGLNGISKIKEGLSKLRG